MAKTDRLPTTLALGRSDDEDLTYFAWMHSRLKIVTKNSELISFTPKPQQMAYFDMVRRQQSLGLPVRIIILKARQIGFTTATEGLFFAETHFNEWKNALVLSHDSESAVTIFEMTRRFHDNMPAHERRATTYSNRRELVYAAPHGSRFRILTAGKDRIGDGKEGTSGRSQTNHLVHCSEVAFWPNADATLAALLQTVPNLPGTMVVLESTANGVGDAFHRRWQAAVARLDAEPDDLDGFVPLFFSWLDEPEYAKPLRPGQILGPLDDEEQFLAELGATTEQLNWRRWKIAQDLNGDERRFQTEFPATAEQAFQSTGRSVFSPAIIHHHQTTVRPFRRGRLLFDTTGQWPHGVRWEDSTDTHEPCWHLWEMPEPRRDYALAGDVSEGVPCDPNDANSEVDMHSAFVLDRSSLTQVAEWLGNIDADLFGLELVKAAYFFNRAWATPEVNSMGLVPLLKFKRAHYARLYRRQTNDERLSVEEADDLGWKTTTANRDMMIDQFVEQMRPEIGFDGAPSYEGRLVIRSARLIEQARVFYWDKRGKRQHLSGWHDDLLFAAFIALQVHLRCPRTYFVPKVPRRKRKGILDEGGYDRGEGGDSRESAIFTRTG